VGSQFLTQINMVQFVGLKNPLQGFSGVVMKSVAVGDSSDVGDAVNAEVSELFQELFQSLGGIANAE